jgi:hypothetical protein
MEALRPPERLERLVLALIPPCARETVAGDLCETYRNPRQYLREALCTVPHLIASQARRNLNLPLLLLQVTLVWWLLGAAAAVLVVPVALLQEAWRPLGRPGAVRAIRETMAVALLAMVVVQHMSFDNHLMRQMGLGHTAWTSLYFFGFMVAPLLCFLRTGLIVSGDRMPAPRMQTLDALAQDYHGFARRIRRRNLIEACALMVAEAFLIVLRGQPILIVTFALASIWLMVPGMALPAPAGADFASLSVHYRQELDRQQQQRRFLSWLWFMPPFLLLHEQAIHRDHPIPAVMATATLLLLSFLVGALNREQVGRTQEDIGALERLREAAA